MLAPLFLIGSLLTGLGITPEMIASRGLAPIEEASTVVVAYTDDDGREFRLTPDAAAAWHDMQAHAAQDSVQLVLVSAFRSINAQAAIIRRKLDAGQPIEAILLVNAPPGYSQHHSGRALDIGTPHATDLDHGFEDTPAFRWLVRYAHHFGFFMPYGRGNSLGYDYEPWHWVYTSSAHEYAHASP